MASKAIEAAVKVLERVSASRSACRCRHQSVVRGDEGAWRHRPYPGAARGGASHAGRGLYPCRGRQHRRLRRHQRPAGTDMITGSTPPARTSIPSCASPARRRARSCTRGGLPGGGHRLDRQTGHQMGDHGAGAGQVPRAFQQAFHLMRSGRPRAGADRPADRRADGRDRIRHRHLRAAARRSSRPRPRRIEKALAMLTRPSARCSSPAAA